MLATDLRHDLVRTVLEPLERTDGAWAEARYREMEREIEAILPPVGPRRPHRAADLRYLGQEHTVTVEVGTSPTGRRSAAASTPRTSAPTATRRRTWRCSS